MDLLFNLAATLAVVSFMFRKVLYIRLMSILSSILYIQYSLNHQLPDIFWWSLIYIAVNTFQVLFIIKDFFPLNLTPELKKIKEIYFPKTSAAEFNKLIKLSHRGQAQDSTLIVKGEPVERLILLTSGLTYVLQNETTIPIAPYHFLGEMSFFNNTKAISNVYTKEKIEFIYWNYLDLYRLQQKNATLFMKLIEATGKDIVLKLIGSDGFIKKRNATH